MKAIANQMINVHLVICVSLEVVPSALALQMQQAVVRMWVAVTEM